MDQQFKRMRAGTMVALELLHSLSPVTCLLLEICKKCFIWNNVLLVYQHKLFESPSISVHWHANTDRCPRVLIPGIRLQRSGEISAVTMAIITDGQTPTPRPRHISLWWVVLCVHCVCLFPQKLLAFINRIEKTDILHACIACIGKETNATRQRKK